MIGTGVFTAVGRRRTGPALGWAMLLTLLMGSGVSAVQVLNPSFESINGTTRPLPRDWFKGDDQSGFYSYCSKLWKTEGTWSAGLFSLVKKPVTAGKYQSFFQQSVDLTGIAAIKFDVQLTVLPYGGTFEHFEASFLVDDVPLWSQRVGGAYLDQEVNVAGMGAWRTTPEGHTLYGHKIEMRITALDTSSAAGFNSAYWTQWDNIRLIEGQPTIPAVVTLDPGTLNPASNGKWITCYIELGQDESGQPYDVNTIDGASVTLRTGNMDIYAHTGDEGWATAAANADNVADFDGDGVVERMVKFDRAAVQALVQPPGPATVSIQGRLASRPTNGILASKPINGILLEGTATIHVLDNKAKK